MMRRGLTLYLWYFLTLSTSCMSGDLQSLRSTGFLTTVQCDAARAVAVAALALLPGVTATTTTCFEGP